MTAQFPQVAEASTAGEKTRSMRTGILTHPSTARSGRFLILPHPRTTVPTYYLHSDTSESCTSPSSFALISSSTNTGLGKGELYELSTLKDGKFDRSWMLSNLNQVISSGQLEILSPIDVKFIVISLLYCVLGGDGKFRSGEDTFEQIALALYGRRKEEMVESILELKVKLGGGEGEQDGLQQEWTDVVTFGNLPLTKKALEEVADVQDLPNGETAYRLSTARVFSILDKKHANLRQKSTFVASPNVLGRTFERRWQSDSDPSAYLTAAKEGEEEADCKEARELRAKIAAEIIATNLPAQLALDYFGHLGIALEN